jgi:hypothetical protein
MAKRRVIADVHAWLRNSAEESVGFNQGNHNPLVGGSNPSAATIVFVGIVTGGGGQFVIEEYSGTATATRDRWRWPAEPLRHHRDGALFMSEIEPGARRPTQLWLGPKWGRLSPPGGVWLRIEAAHDLAKIVVGKFLQGCVPLGLVRFGCHFLFVGHSVNSFCAGAATATPQIRR